MTPAERDEVRRIAAARLANHAVSSDPQQCPCFECVAFRAVLRYVPAGCVTHPVVSTLDVEPEIPPAFRLSVEVLGQRVQPADAHYLAHALHAAADAAEETDR